MKRKVTDLLPTEAILISNDLERDAVLNLFHEAGIKWVSGTDVTNWYSPFNYPFGLQLSAKKLFNEPLWYLDKLSCTIYPATDFIGSDGEIDNEETVLLSDVRNKLTPIKNLIAMLESGFIAPSGSQELIYKELKQCKVNIEELTLNTPTNEQRTK